MSDFTIRKEDREAVKAYVTAADHLQYRLLPQGVVAVGVTHCNLPQKLLDLRFDLHWTVIRNKNDTIRTQYVHNTL